MRWWQIRKRDADLERELQSDLTSEEDEQRERGLSSEESHYAAQRAFGNPALIREQARATWSTWLESLYRDIRFAFRALQRTPGFTAIAIVVMALGVGANVALFTVVRGVILKPLPFQDPDRLVMLYEAKLRDQDSPGYNGVAGGIYAQWKKLNETFTSLALVRGSRVLLSGSGGQLPEKLDSGEFSWDLLPTLGVQPALGRNFIQSEDSPSADGTALLSWGLWKRRFGGDPQILNRTIDIDARPFTVIGVMPAWFSFPDTSTRQWLPVYHEREEKQMNSLSMHMLSVVGRLKPGVSQAQAIADLSLISRRVHDANLNDPFIFSAANGRPLLDDLVGDMKLPLYLLLAATACVLLIACLNVANLLVARAAARRKDLAIRTALGGGLLRLMRERLFESLLLSIFGGILGLGFAEGALQWLVRTRQDMNRVEDIHFDAVVAVFTIAVVCLCAFVTGLISTFSTKGKDILTALHESSRAVGGERGETRLRRILLSVEVSLTVVLLIGAGLLSKVMSAYALRIWDASPATCSPCTSGFQMLGTRRVHRASRSLTRFSSVYAPCPESQEQVSLIPLQVKATQATKTSPSSSTPRFHKAREPPLSTRTADSTYFETMGIPLVGGRTFNPALRLNNANEVVVDQSFVQTFFPGEDPLGKHINIKDKKYVIVGVVGPTRFEIGENPRPMMYTSLKAGNESVGTIVLRSNQDVASYALPVQRIVAEIDPDLAVSDVLTMDQLLGETTLSASFNATLLVAFATLSLLLAAAGLFGVLSYIAAQRTHEIGLRIALGAQREQVLQLMLVDGIRPAFYGLVVGLAASAGLARLIQSMLYGTRPLDPAIFAAVAATLIVVAALACILPAWRASRLDPMQALRTE